MERNKGTHAAPRSLTRRATIESSKAATQTTTNTPTYVPLPTNTKWIDHSDDGSVGCCGLLLLLLLLLCCWQTERDVGSQIALPLCREQ